MKNKKHTPKEIKIKIVEDYQNGVPIEELSQSHNISERTIFNWLKIYEKNKNLESNKIDGRGRPPKINTDNGQKLLDILKQPASIFGFENDLWNTVRIKNICKKILKISVSKMAIWRYLTKFEHSFKKTQKQYYETDIKSQEDWKKSTLPKIKKTVHEHRSILYFLDESSIQLSPVMGKSWGPIGEKIVHRVTGNRGSISAISTISNDGRLLFNVFDGGKRFKSDDIISYLESMLKHHPRRHLVVIMDRATCHKSKKTKAFIDSKKRLEVFYLPARSPQLNPDEQVWAHLKNHELKSHQKNNLKDLKILTQKKLKKLSEDTKKVKGIFKRCDNAKLYL
jgi:transposase